MAKVSVQFVVDVDCLPFERFLRENGFLKLSFEENSPTSDMLSGAFGMLILNDFSSPEPITKYESLQVVSPITFSEL